MTRSTPITWKGLAAAVALLGWLATTGADAFAASCSAQASGDWHAPGTWTCSGADADGVPDGDDSVATGTRTLTVAQAAAAGSLALEGGAIAFSGATPLAVAGGMSTTGGTLRGNGTLTVGDDLTKTTGATLFVTNDGGLGSPDLVLDANGSIQGGSICVARTGDQDPDVPNLHINGTFTIAEGAAATPFTCSGAAVAPIHVNPDGHLVKAAGGTMSFSTRVENDGRLTVEAGALTLVGGTGGTSDGAYVAEAGTTLQFGSCCAERYDLGPTARLGGAGTVLLRANPMTLADGATLDPAVLNVEFGTLALEGTTPLTLPATGRCSSPTTAASAART